MPDTGKFCVSLTTAGSDPERTITALTMAKEAQRAGHETMLFLSMEAAILAVTGGDDIDDNGTRPVRGLMENFVGDGGQIFVSGPCFRRRRLNDDQLMKGASLVGGEKLVEFLSEGTPCLSY